MVAFTNISLIERLESAQADALVLHLNARRYEDAACAAGDRALSMLFGAIARAKLASAARLGERVHALGGDALTAVEDTRMMATVQLTDLRSSCEALDEALRTERLFVRELREASAAARSGGEWRSDDLFRTLAREHEAWTGTLEGFLFAYDALAC